MSAQQRREQVVGAALAEFASRGFDGTSTEDIARRAGISQPYLFRLFPTKKDLFIAAVTRGFARVAETFERAADGLTGEEAMNAMGEAYGALLSDRDLLMCQLHAYAASDDPVVREATRAGFRRLWRLVEAATGLPVEQVRGFFAQGMLLNVVAALDLDEVQESWAQGCYASDPCAG